MPGLATVFSALIIVTLLVSVRLCSYGHMVYGFGLSRVADIEGEKRQRNQLNAEWLKSCSQSGKTYVTWYSPLVHFLFKSCLMCPLLDCHICEANT